MGTENYDMHEHRFKQIEKDIEDIKDKNSRDHKEFFNRIEAVEKDMVESQGDRKHITQQLEEINVNVKALMQKPGKRYETIITSVLTAVIGALVGFVLSGILPM